MSTDLRPAATVLADLVSLVDDAHLTAPTPCGGIPVAALLDHIDTFCVAFTAAALKTGDGGGAPEPDAARLGPGWRDRVPARLHDLAEAWRTPGAWSGTTDAGGLTMPAGAAGAVALDELLVHGWDLAAATGRPYPAGDPALAEAVDGALGWVRTVVDEHPEGSPGLFGAPVAVHDQASAMDRLLGLTGRDPRWRP